MVGNARGQEMKRLLLILVLIGLLIVGCNGNEDTPVPSPTPTQGPTSVVGVSPTPTEVPTLTEEQPASSLCSPTLPDGARLTPADTIMLPDVGDTGVTLKCKILNPLAFVQLGVQEALADAGVFPSDDELKKVAGLEPLTPEPTLPPVPLPSPSPHPKPIVPFVVPPQIVPTPIVVVPTVTVSDQTPEISISELEKQIHDLTNVQRSTHGLSSVSWNPAVSDIARNHSQDMANREYFSHTNPEGLGPCDRFEQAGYPIRQIPTDGKHYILGCSENIFQGNLVKKNWYVNGSYSHSEYYTLDELAVQTVDGWMNSTGHRENILTEYWSSEGIGIAIADDGKVYITQNFS